MSIRKIFAVVTTLLVTAVIAAGCNIGKENGVEKLFSCSAKNIIGISGAYVDDVNNITVSFNTNSISKDGANKLSAEISDVFEKSLYSHGVGLVMDDTDDQANTAVVNIQPESISVNGTDMTITFDAGDIQVKDIKGFVFHFANDDCGIDLENGKVTSVWASVRTSKMFTRYSQSSSFFGWSNVQEVSELITG